MPDYSSPIVKVPNITDEECLRLARKIYPIGLGTRKTIEQGSVFKHIGAGVPNTTEDANIILKAWIETHG